MKSMTGFGVSRISSPHLELDVTIKALNGRYLEIRTHLPKEYAAFDRDLKSIVGQSIRRGTLEVYVMRRTSGGQQSELVIDQEAVRQWVKAAKKVAQLSGQTYAANPVDIMRTPELVSWRTKGVTSNEKDLLLKALKKAIALCMKEQVREGKALQKNLTELFAKLEAQVKRMHELALQTQDELKKRIEDRLKRSPLNADVTAERLAQEVVIYVDRADVAEEIHRLQEHIRQCRQLLSSEQDSLGKSLDFYSQELLREVNTIGSKSPLASLTEAVVTSKTLIEQIKEQVQNVS